MFHLITVGLEHLQTGVEFQNEQGVSISFHADGPTTFIAASLQPFQAIWRRADFRHPVILHSRLDENWRMPLPDTSHMIRERVERNNILQRTARPQFVAVDPDQLDLNELVGNLRAVGLPTLVFDESTDLPHTKVPHGQCPICGHYGHDCTGQEVDHA